MSKLRYLFKRILGMNFKNMFNIINKTKERCNKSKFIIFIDMIWCGFKYQAGYMDYYLYGFYDLNSKERSTHITRGKNDKYIKYFNNKEYVHYFNKKNEFNDKFSKYLHRDYINLNNNEAEFKSFIKNKDYIICKPAVGSCGKGIEKIKVSDYKNKKLYNYLVKNNLTVIEEVVKQNKVMNKLYNGSVNTIRVVSILHNNEVNIVFTCLRIGTGGNFVDNFNNGGIVAPINVESGIIKFPAVSKDGKVYKKHPTTNTNIVGFRIPLWNDVIDIVKEAALVVPQVAMVGWDVAISEKGVLLIEANEYPGHDLYQLPVHRNDGIGVLPIFEKIIKLK